MTKGHQMTTLYRAYTSTHEAEDAIERLLAAGAPETGIQLIMGVAIKDARDKPIGTWAGTTTPRRPDRRLVRQRRTLRPRGDGHVRR
jgi:hypothetical protein